MIEAQIPKDIRKYEAKLAGPFTLRQLICFTISCFIAYGAYTCLNLISMQKNAVPICMLIVAPIVAIGWIKPYGMPLEKFLKTAFISNILSPKTRKYKTKNTFRFEDIDIKKTSHAEYKKRLKHEKKLALKNADYERFA